MSVIETSAGHRPRTAFFNALIGVITVLLFAGLAYRQLFGGEGFAERERLQNQRRILIPGPRGEIYDREGRLLVANRPRFSAVLYFSDARLRRELREEQLELVRDAREHKLARPPEGFDARARADVVQRYLDDCGRILHQHFEVDRAGLERHFRQQPLLPYPILRDLEPPEFAALLEQMSTGSPVQILPSTTRHYPYGNAAAHTLGFVTSTLDVPDEGLEGADLTTFYVKGTFGRDGLERQMDGTLQGQTGSEIWVVDPAGFQVEMVKNQTPVSGRPVYTSLDIDLQLAGEEAFGDREGALVVLDVQTGEVLALVSKPDYDLNDLTPFISREVFNDIRDRGAWINRAMQGIYPPGSPFKLVTAIAGLRTGAITPDTTFECPGYLMVGNRKFPCHNHAGHGVVDLSEAIRKSCNVFFYNTALAAGPDAIAAEARRFGFDRPTGIELPHEVRNTLVADPAWKKAREGASWTRGDTANMAIGQGFLAVTPLQMACFAASIARGETTTQPTILRRPPGAGIAATANQNIGLTPRDWATLREGMFRVVQDGGTGKFARVDGVNLGGKTGTAQVRTPRGTLELAWFLGFGPWENPRVAIALVVVGDQPDEANAGGQVAAPVAKKVLSVYFKKHPPLQPAAPIVAGAVPAPGIR